MKGQMPWLKWFPSDWRNDPALSMCSPATRGIWMDALCAMHDNNRSGQLQGSVAALARVCRCTPDEMQEALEELEQTGAADVQACNALVTLINRRMLTEASERLKTAERVSKHRQVKRTCNALVTPQKIEDRYTVEGDRPPDLEKLGPACKAFISMCKRVYSLQKVNINQVTGELAMLRSQGITAKRVIALCKADHIIKGNWRAVHRPAHFAADFIDMEVKLQAEGQTRRAKDHPVLKPENIAKRQAEAAAVKADNEKKQQAAIDIITENDWLEDFASWVRKTHPVLESMATDLSSFGVRVAAVEYVNQKEGE